MIFKLAQAPEKTWRRVDGHNQLPKIILGVTFTDVSAKVSCSCDAALPPSVSGHRKTFPTAPGLDA
jgi:hypothetical protein